MIHPIYTVVATAAEAAAVAADPMYAWSTPDGDIVLLGERNVLAALAADLAAFLADGTHGEPVSQYDLPGESYDIGQAVQEAMAHGYSTDADQMADTIRAACRAGRIVGAAQTDTGRWMLPKRQFRQWLQSSQPKPRETASLYRVAITTIDTQRFAALGKLLSGYGGLVNADDPNNYEVMLTPVQAERIQQRHGTWLQMMPVQE